MSIKKSAKLSTLLISAVVVIGLLVPAISSAQTADTRAATIAALQAQLQALQAQINALRAPNQIVPMPVPTIPIEPIDDSDFEDIVQFNNLIVRGVSGPSFPAEIRASYEVGVRCQKFQSESASGLEYSCPLSPSVLYTIKVDSDTRLLLRNRERASLANFEIGDSINVYGFTDSGVSSIDAVVVRNLSKPVRQSFIQLNNMEVLSAPSSGVPPASFTVVNKYFSPCRDFSDNPNSGVTIPCPVGLEIQEQVQPDAGGAMEAISAYYPIPKKYLIEVTSQTVILQRDRTSMALSEIAAGDILNIYGSYTNSSQNIKALVIRDLSMPAKNRGSLQVTVNSVDVVCMLGQQTPSQQIQSGGGAGGGHSDGGPSVISQPCGTIYHATVDLYSASGALIGTQTTERGAAFFENVLAGEYMITASAKGYYKSKTNVSIGTGEVTFATINLSPLFSPPFPTPIPLPTPFPTPPPLDNQTPVISGVKGPTALKIGETGTWSVSAYDPQNGALYYWVIWGDETSTTGGSEGSDSPMSLKSEVSQTATFTHSYSASGIYTPVFYVTNNQGLSAKTSISVNVGAITPQPLGNLYIEVDTGSGFAQTSDTIKVDVGQSRRVRAMYQPAMPTCYPGQACIMMMPVPQEVSAQWTSSNPNIANVTMVIPFCLASPLEPCNGFTSVSGVSAGTAEIKALYAPYPNAYTATAKVTVATPSTQPSITVISPNGGEQWQAGQAQTITWAQTKIDKVTIYLMRTDSLTEATIVSNYSVPIDSTKGSYTYTPPANIMLADTYKIWIIGYQTNVGQAQDRSDATFSIVAATSKPSITLLAPNGGKSLLTGDTSNIKWCANASARETAGPTRLYLITPGTEPSPLFNITEESARPALCPNVSSFTWRTGAYSAPDGTILQVLPGDGYKIRVEYRSADGSSIMAFDESDAVFSIISQTAKFQIGDRVKTKANLNVRSGPYTLGTLLGTQPSGTLGTVLYGPTLAGGHTWWYIDYDNAPDGWSIQNYLEKIIPVTLSVSSLNPSYDPVGTQVVISGTGFTSTGNMVLFGSGAIPNLSSSDGRTISFVVPSTLNPICYYSEPRCLMPSFQLVPGLYQISVKNTNGTSNALPFTVTTSVSSLTITTSSLPAGTVGTAYSQMVSASGGSSSYSWSITSGALPSGLSLIPGVCIATPCQTSVMISGTPTTAGTYTFTLMVKDGQTSASKQFTITVSPQVSTKFSVGDRVKTTAIVNVRRLPYLSGFIGPILGTQAIGALGTVLTSSLSTLVTTYPAYVNGYWWWNINFDNGADGWVTENYLESVATLGLVSNSSQTASIFEAMKAALLEMSKTLNSLR